MNPNLANAILGKVAFRGDDMRRYSAAAIYAALALYPQTVAADDIPAELRPPDQTTAGCCFAALKCAGVRVFQCVGRRTSRTTTRNGARINEYKINFEIALTWLRRNKYPIPNKDKDVLAGQMLLT